MREAQRLGRGLAALLGDATPAQSADPAGMIAVEKLDVNPYQPRKTISPEALQDLAASITAQGILQPLLVRPNPDASGRFQIIAGERRWRAAQLAGLKTVPCYVRPLQDRAVSAAALVENLQRTDLNPIEEAEGFRRVIGDFGMTQDVLGDAIGKSRSYVANQLRLLQLPASVQAHVQSGALSAGHARAALSHADPAAAAQAMLDGQMSVREAENLASGDSQRQAARKRAADKVEDPDLKAVQADLSEILGLAVSISFDGAGGMMKLRYRTLDQLDHLIARLGAKPSAV